MEKVSSGTGPSGTGPGVESRAPTYACPLLLPLHFAFHRHVSQLLPREKRKGPVGAPPYPLVVAAVHLGSSPARSFVQDALDTAISL